MHWVPDLLCPIEAPVSTSVLAGLTRVGYKRSKNTYTHTMPGLLRTNGRQSNNDDSVNHHESINNTNGNDETGSTEEDSPSVEEISSDEFPSHFVERNGRLFPSNGTPCPLPVDTPEQERNTFLHQILLQLHGANYIGPVPEVLAVDSSRRKRVLDICTGNGIWALEMATEFPHIRFVGFDHVPLATRYPPSNVRFEIGDVNERYRWQDASFDLVHARSINMAVRNYRAVMEEIARVLRPGGLFLSLEWGHFITLHPSWHGDISTHAPASCRFFYTMNGVLGSYRDSQPVNTDMAQLLTNVGGFEDISTTTHYLPIGTWPADPALRSMGEKNLAAQERYADSVRHSLVETGRPQEGVDLLLAEYLDEIRSVGGIASVCYAVCARKV